MNKLALNLPGNYQIANPPGLNSNFNSVGNTVSLSLNLVFYLAGFLMIIWMSWGIFQYIFAGGNKEALAKARLRIVWSIVGFILVLVAFALSQSLQRIFPANLNNVTPVTAPSPFKTP